MQFIKTMTSVGERGFVQVQAIPQISHPAKQVEKEEVKENSKDNSQWETIDSIEMLDQAAARITEELS